VTSTSVCPCMTDVSSRLFTEGERPSDRHSLVAALALVALHSRLCPLAPDKKLCKAGWQGGC
jgi:hypothetical protein